MHILDALHHKRIRFGMEERSCWWIRGEVGAVGAQVGVEASGCHTVAAIALHAFAQQVDRAGFYLLSNIEIMVCVCLETSYVVGCWGPELDWRIGDRDGPVGDQLETNWRPVGD